jgi:hypothetical protein
MDHNQLIRQMLDNIQADNAAAAQEDFETLMAGRISDALDQRKQNIAQNLSAANTEPTEN